MIVCPASMGFCALGRGGTRVGPAGARRRRACSRRSGRSSFVPRETPFSLIHLRNLTSLAEAGATIVPAMPAFYQRPATIDDQINFVAGKVLDAARYRARALQALGRVGRTGTAFGRLLRASRMAEYGIWRPRRLTVAQKPPDNVRA